MSDYNHWHVKSLNDLAEIGSGTAPLSKNGSIPIMGANGQIGWTEHSNFELGYLVGRVGAVGAIKYVNSPCWASDNTLTVKAKSNACGLSFLGHLLAFLHPEKLATKNAQPLITQTNLSRLSAAIPKLLAEQEVIATILNFIDDAIHQTEATITKLRQVKAGMLHDLLTRGLDENGELRDPIQHPAQFKESRFGQIPKTWKIKPAHELCLSVIDCKNRTPPITKEGHPVIRTPNVRIGDFIFEDLLYTDPTSYKEWTTRGTPESGDVVITREAPFGEACIIPDNLHAPCLGQRMMMYKVDPTKLNNEFLVWTIYSVRIQKLFLELAGGSTVGHLRVGDIRDLPIPYPTNLDEQVAIVKYMAGISCKITSESKYCSKLQSLKQGLMHDLLTGKVRVPEKLLEAPP